MNPELSTYLNMLRVLAATAVFVGHICIWQVGCGFVDGLPWLGGDGVVIFFVLSGYVVAYTADTKDRTARAFLINRCARIYSVMVPALILTLVLERIGVRYFPGSYNALHDHYQLQKLWVYIPLWMSFSSELWTLNEPMLTNGAFWSLCFEVWFYVFLALSLFMRGPARVAALIVVPLIVGPKICLLFPLWGLGVLAYRAQKKISLQPLPARLLFLLSIGLYMFIKAYALDNMATEGVDEIFGNVPRLYLQVAYNFPGHLMIAVCVAMSIFAMRFAALRQIARVAYPVGIAASFTFTIYLMHLPLMKFFVTLGGPDIESMVWPTMATLAAVVAIGSVTERRIGPWRILFARLVRFADRLAGNAVLATRRG